MKTTSRISSSYPLKFLFLITLFLTFSNRTLAESGQVRVRMATSKQNLSLRGASLELVAESGSRTGLGSQLRISREKSSEGKWQWLLQGEDLKQISGANIFIESKVPFLSEVQALPQRLQLVAQNGRFHVVAYYEMKEYLQGVVAAEMPLAWPKEALKAQLVAARSYTLSVMNSRRSRRFWDVEKGIMDQAFEPEFRMRVPAVYVQRLEEAYEETKGHQLNYGKEVLKSYYHAQCGGHSQSPRKKWGHGPDWGEAHDPHCATTQPWSLVLSKEALSQRLKEKKLIPDTLLSLNIDQMSSTLKVDQVEIQTGAGHRKLKGHELRKTLGYSEMKSTNFKLKQIGDSYHFEGFGYGHGVGLCQWGAKKMAGEGKTYKEILQHYYPKASLVL